MATATEINSFLAQAQTALGSNNYKILDKRRKYISTKTQLGIVDQDVIDDIKNLTASENWTKEPDNNPTYPGDVWICKKHLHGECIYIKLKSKPSPSGELLIMSYHIDEV